MLLRSDPEAQIVPGDNGLEQVQGGGGYGRDPERQLTDEHLGLESPIHPLGIKPSGNKLLGAGTTDAREAIGAFQALPDGTASSDANLGDSFGIPRLTSNDRGSHTIARVS